ncbi:SDR family NAD(P)-dependent oxidoreductase [Rhizobium cauense]|uniref:SDR family NAD(P)-dependent oxidoreductase n=1 Tax=Rhizobium cauense TaxID=1166683 RepID=UPI001C6EA564|nr:SDR family NAD(P)-dependent oxidoreductase [Rhizobium cauense]MBW9116454.1 SDR family NAD(P)-dependent oxidoreductase [Rhizobium cauense]
MDLKLEGKRALVTGSTAGLGEAIVKMLAAEGAAVVVHGRDESRARSIAYAIAGMGQEADFAVGDLSTDAGADAVRQRVGGDVDILVNNAGAYRHLSWETATPREWARTYDVNVLSGVRMVERFVPPMRERGWGRVIQIGGGLAGQPLSGLPDYSASLAARHNLAVSLARELRDTGVTSNIVAPGAILVPAVRAFFEEIAPERGWGGSWDEIERNSVRDMVPNDVGRLGRPDEIAAAVAFLASEHADYISGATIRVDGGAIRSAF